MGAFGMNLLMNKKCCCLWQRITRNQITSPIDLNQIRGADISPMAAVGIDDKAVLTAGNNHAEMIIHAFI